MPRDDGFIPDTKAYEITEQKYATRLQEMLRVLEDLPNDYKHEVSMCSWFSCETKACVAGWCGQDPWFKSRGFKTIKREHDQDNVHFKDEDGQVETGGEACRRFFGIGSRGCDHLFGGSADGGRDSAIERTKAFIKENVDPRLLH